MRPRPIPQRLKVLRIIARLNIGGPARHVMLLQRHLTDLGYDSVLAYGVPGPGERELAIDPSISAVSIAALGRSVRVGSDLVAFWRVLRLALQIKPDIIHTHTAKAGTLGRLAAFAYNRTVPRARRCAVLHTFHGHVFRGYFSPRVSRLVQSVERALARITDRVVTISTRQRADIVDVFRIAPAEKVVVVPLGLNLDPLTDISGRGDAIRRGAGFDRNAMVCGYVGRLVPIKNVDLLLRACVRAFHDVPNGRLLIVGDGERRAELESAAAAAGLGPRVHFAGWQSDLAEVYGAMDLVALCSINEGTPVALIEAMAAGRAVVSTDVGGVGEVVTDGVTGLLVRDGDEAGLAAAIARLLTDASERQRFGAAARADVVDRFSYQRLVRDIDRLYRDTVRAVREDSTLGSEGTAHVRD